MSYYFDIFTKQCGTISFYCKNVTQNVTQNLVVSHIIIIFASQTLIYQFYGNYQKTKDLLL